MIRDPSPIHQLGFGVTSRQQPLLEGVEAEEGVDPNSSGIAKALHDHPVMRFFAVAGATMAGMAVGGKVVREGGVRLAMRMQESAAPWAANTIKGIRRSQKIMDQWQGIERIFAGADDIAKAADYDASSTLFVRDGKRILRDEIVDNKTGFWVTKAERETAQRLGTDTPTQWLLRDEVQKRMVQQARRLPYELPAAYAVQRGLTEPILGGPEKSDVNWYNPVDVMTDFVNTSVKNLATMILPFDAGVAAAGHGGRRFLTLLDDFDTLSPQMQKAAGYSVALKDVLKLVGTDATDVINKTIRLSAQSTGALATGIKEARTMSKGTVQILDELKNDRSRLLAQAKAGGRTHTIPNPELLDMLPGPFKGMMTGIRAGRARYGELKEGYSAFDELMQKGRRRFDFDHDMATPAGAARQRAVQRVLGGSGSPIEELSNQIATLGAGGPTGSAFRHSKFFKGQSQVEYQKLLKRQLIGKGVDEAAADQATRLVTVSFPTGEKHLSNRVHFGKKPFDFNDPKDIAAELSRRLPSKHFRPQDKTAIEDNFRSAVMETDSLFQMKPFNAAMTRKIESQWNLLESKVVPQFGENILQKTRMGYHQFTGPLTEQKELFLKRKTAQMTGFSLTDKFGRIADDTELNAHLARKGFRPDNYDQMRAHLVNRKAINKPWNQGAANIFGLRRLTIAEGLDRGYFRGGQYSDDEVRRITNKMAAADPLPMGQYELGGVYRTASGRIIDVNRVKRSAQRTLDNVSDQTQIPLLHFSPLELFGYSSVKDLRERAIIQYSPGMAKQPFMGANDAAADFHIWLRRGGKGTKGSVFSFSQDATTGRVGASEARGLYRPFASNAGNLAARQARIAAGDIGESSPADTPSGFLARKIGDARFRRIKSAFNVDPNQPDSLFRYFGRFMNRHQDINNPRVLATLLRDGEVSRKGKTLLRLAGNEVVDDAGKVRFNAQDTANAFRNFTGELRGFGYSPKVQKFLGEDAQFRGLFSYKFGDDVTPRTFELEGGRVDVTKLNTPAQLREAAKLIHTGDKSLVGMGGRLDSARRNALRRAQEALLWRHLDESGSASHWDRIIPGANRSTALHTRMDEMQADIYRYLSVRQELVSTRGFDALVPDFTSRLQKLRSAGRISQAEFTEARAALLSTQVNISVFSKYVREDSTLTNINRVMEDIVDSARTGGSMRDLLGTAARAEAGIPGRLGRLRPELRRRFGSAPYEFEGTSYNPTGRSTSTFVPTFGTAFERNPVGAVSSVLGLNTWSNTQSFSGSSIPVGHFIERLNKYADIAGLSLDPTAYRGPADLFARGLVGQRALPIFAAGATAMAVDRTIGGMVTPRDSEGNMVYRPFILGGVARGVAEVQIGLAGVLPGGESYTEKRQEIMHGEVPVRTGRWWPLGNTPWEGGRIEYFRPSWYRRMMSGYKYTDQGWDTPIEQLAFGYDFSPLRPLDPYRFERQHYYDRPYPTTGDYFTGPWGPLNSILNSTVGRVLKPRFDMHETATSAGLAAYERVGEAGAYQPVSVVAGGGGGFGTGSGGAVVGAANASMGSSPGVSGGSSSVPAIGEINRGLASAGQVINSTAAGITSDVLGSVNSAYASAAYNGPSSGQYGTPDYGRDVMDPRIVGASTPISHSNLGYQAGQIGYEMQEMLGIYGFMFGSLREGLGLGTQDYTPDKPVLASASQAYSTTRGFWDLNLGGLGDAPMPVEGNFANVEFSEIVRRFIPRERSGVNSVNPIPNTMGLEHPWLPGSNYYLNFKQGDPYTTVAEGEMRLPGTGYERFNTLNPDITGKYGVVDRHKILGDVAPWSAEYKAIDQEVAAMNLTPTQRAQVETTRQQVVAKSVANEFTPYEYKYQDPGEVATHPLAFAAGRAAEWFEHRNSFFNTKFMPTRTAVEDWEREYVYGSTFPQWQNPIEDYLEPLVHTATQRNPWSASVVLGTVGSLFGRSPMAKMIGSVVGGATGLAASAYGTAYEATTGDRFIPQERRQQIALDEYVDILSYVKNQRLYKQAEASGNAEAASQYKRASQMTMYGADIYNGDINTLSAAMPKRKREHFRAMMTAPPEEHDQILSTAGRLERRLLEAAWGRPVEQRPELEEYFEQHELPAEDWEGWHPNTNMDHVKIKIGQSLGIEMSEMGYYPQQVREANLVNPAFPSYMAGGNNTQAQLRQLMTQRGISGDVIPIHTPYPGTRLQIDAGLLSGV